MNDSDFMEQIGYDPYLHNGGTRPTLPNEWRGLTFYEWATAKAPGEPLMLGEWGLDLDPDNPAHVPIIEWAKVSATPTCSRPASSPCDTATDCV